jgi:hypothetical protein
MRQNVIIVLLSICATLLGVNLVRSFARPDHPLAFGQGVGLPTGQVAIATVQGSGNEPWCYVYDVATKRLACYAARNQGLELKGMRNIQWDLQIEDLPPELANRRVPVVQIKKEVEKLRKTTAAPATKTKEKEKPAEEEEEATEEEEGE